MVKETEYDYYGEVYGVPNVGVYMRRTRHNIDSELQEKAMLSYEKFWRNSDDIIGGPFEDYEYFFRVRTGGDKLRRFFEENKKRKTPNESPCNIAEIDGLWYLSNPLFPRDNAGAAWMIDGIENTMADVVLVHPDLKMVMQAYDRLWQESCRLRNIYLDLIHSEIVPYIIDKIGKMDMVLLRGAIADKNRIIRTVVPGNKEVEDIDIMLVSEEPKKDLKETKYDIERFIGSLEIQGIPVIGDVADFNMEKGLRILRMARMKSKTNPYSHIIIYSEPLLGPDIREDPRIRELIY